MTITREERERIINGSEESTDPQPRPKRSGVAASSLMGMLAGLGTLFLLSGLLSAGVILIDLEFDLAGIGADLQDLSVIGLSIAALVIIASTLVGGFVAGRIARWGGMGVGIASSLWLMLILAVFAGLALWIGTVSNALDGIDPAGQFSDISTADLTTAAAIAGGGLFVLALVSGLVGGRLGQTEEAPVTDTVVDLTEEPDAAEARAVDDRISV